MMKNFKISMILIAAVALFCSCGGGDEENNPTITVTDANQLTETTMDLRTDATKPLDLIASIAAPKGIETIAANVYYYSADSAVISSVQMSIEGDFVGLESAEVSIKDTIVAADIPETCEWLTYEFVVTDKKTLTATAEYKIDVYTSQAPITTVMEEGSFLWKRKNVDATTTAEFGIEWTMDDAKADAFPRLAPLAGAELYAITADQFATIVDNFSELTLANPITTYYKVSGINWVSQSSATLDEYIATKYNGKTYLMHLTSADKDGSTRQLHGAYKVFTENTPEAK